LYYIVFVQIVQACVLACFDWLWLRYCSIGISRNITVLRYTEFPQNIAKYSR